MDTPQQKNNKLTDPSTKELFDGFEKETQEIKILQKIMENEQTFKMLNDNSANEINYYKS